MPRLLRKKPEPIPRSCGALPAGADHSEWASPVTTLHYGLRVLSPESFFHVTDPRVTNAPHLFRRVDTGEPVGPEPRKSAHSNSL